MEQSTSTDRTHTKHNLFSLRQPVTRTLQGILAKTWIQTMLHLSPVSPLFTHLASLPLGPYKDKRALLDYMGKGSYISPRAQIKCPELIMGPKCFIDDYVTIYAHRGACGSVHLEQNVHIYRWSIIELGKGEGSISIGANTFIQPGCILNAFVGNIHIGANCMIAPHCAFTPYQHGYVDTHRPMREQPLTSRGDIVIEDDVWLGVNVCVMDGVTIGQGAIVGAGAVVTNDIPRYAIAGGIPARVIRFRDTEAETPCNEIERRDAKQN
jgi:acetyltransferase-like isoleucine patch superfamily enzyme